MNVKVFSARQPGQLEAEIQSWLDRHREIRVEGLTQSTAEDEIVVTLLYSLSTASAPTMGFRTPGAARSE